MSDHLLKLLEKAKKVQMSPEQREEQRRSFAYGNAKIENDRVTRESINKQAELLAAERDSATHTDA